MKKLSNMWRYVFFTYITFWIMVLGIGGVVTVLTGGNALIMQLVVILCSWAPTFVLLAMSKKILNGRTIKEFYKDAFRDKISFADFCYSTLTVLGLFFVGIILLGLIKDGRFSVLENLSLVAYTNNSITSVLCMMFFNVMQGASGEESGWRGYMLPEVNKQYGFIKGNIILGLVWAFWHLPLWFISTGFTGIKLVQYIVSFIIFAVSFTIVTGWMQKRCRNLFLAFWMHFLVNFSIGFGGQNQLLLITIIAVLYLVTAMIIAVREKKEENHHN